MEYEWEEVKSDSGIWLPEKVGEELIGEIVEIRQGQYGTQLVIEREDGTKVSTPSHKALQSRLNGFRAGEIVKIVYTGEDLPKVKGQNPTKLYGVSRGKPKEEQVK